MNEKKKMKFTKKLLIGLAVLILIAGGAFYVYVSDYYPAQEAAIETAVMNTEVEISSQEGALVFDPGNADTALIFYPGGKVEYTAYEPLMIEIAQLGILCILPEMPFNLAVFDANAAADYISEYPNISHWYLGGHSLGGSMSARFAAENSNKIEGLILLASYSTSDLASSDMRVLSIYGSKDLVMNQEAYQENRSNLPENMTELVLEGGNHAGFGSYGEQQGDGVADITAKQQQTDTAKAIAEFCLNMIQ